MQVVKINLNFLGGALEVGRSAMLLESNGIVMVFDYGVQVSEPPKYPRMPDHADSLVLSHAHLDHTGMAPALFKKQSLPSYATSLTFQLARILQQDNLKVTEQEGYPLPYVQQDIQNAGKGEIPLEYRNPRRIHTDISMELRDAGHIPGSASVLLELEGKRFMYTGDINNRDTRLLYGADIPQADVLAIEATYGDRLHPDRSESEKTLLESIRETVESGGIALLPVFAVGRSQEILMVLKDLELPIYLDGMAKLACKVILSNGGYVRNAKELQEAVNNAIWVEHDSQRKDICSEPCVIVTTSGMLNGGPVITYLRLLADDPKNSILLTGYQVEDTNGRMLVEKGHIIDPDTRKKTTVQAGVKQYDFSAHADQKGLLEIVERVKPKDVILMHGSPEATTAMEEKLEGKYRVHAPAVGETIEI